MAWKARQPDTSKEDEEQRKQEEEENERARRLEEAEKAAKIQQELARDEALKANAMRLTDLICEVGHCWSRALFYVFRLIFVSVTFDHVITMILGADRVKTLADVPGAS